MVKENGDTSPSKQKLCFSATPSIFQNVELLFWRQSASSLPSAQRAVNGFHSDCDRSTMLAIKAITSKLFSNWLENTYCSLATGSCQGVSDWLTGLCDWDFSNHFSVDYHQLEATTQVLQFFPSWPVVARWLHRHVGWSLKKLLWGALFPVSYSHLV